MALTDDLILEILLRLPVKSLVRFQCGCKPWRTSISSSNFVARHCSRQNQGSSLRILYSANPPQCVDHETLLSHNKGDGPVPSAVLPLDHVPGNRAIVGSCNGLICLLGRPGRFFLWNPSTRQINALPILASFRNVSERGHMFYGFGYDSKGGGDYKVVCGIKPVVLSGNPTTKIAVFSLKRGSWRTRVRFQDADFAQLFGAGCLSNGALHWLQYLKDERKLHLLSSKARIIAFDLHKEEFQGIVQLSDLIDAEWVTSAHAVTGTSTDSIYLVYDSPSYTGTDLVFTVSKMKEYKVQQSWPLEIKGGDRNFFVPRVMCMLEKGGGLMRFLMTFRNTDLALYDPEEKACMTDLVTSDRFYPNVSAMFTETLVSPITGHGVDIVSPITGHGVDI